MAGYVLLCLPLWVHSIYLLILNTDILILNTDHLLVIHEGMMDPINIITLLTDAISILLDLLEIPFYFY